MTDELKAAQRYADYAASREIERFCDWKKGGWRDMGLSGPLVCFAVEYLRSRGRIEQHPKKPGWFRITDERSVPSAETE